MSPETVEALSNVGIMLAAIAIGMLLGRLTDLKFPWVKEHKPRCKKCGEDFGLCYSPEFIALGSIIRDFMNPDVIPSHMKYEYYEKERL